MSCEQGRRKSFGEAGGQCYTGRGQRSHLLLFYQQGYSSSLMPLHKSTPRCGRKAHTSHQDCRFVCPVCRVTMECIKGCLSFNLKGKMHSCATPWPRRVFCLTCKKENNFKPRTPKSSYKCKCAPSLICSQPTKPCEPRKQTLLFPYWEFV